MLSSTLDEVYAWLTSNRLSDNPSKTEFLIIGNPQQRNKIQSSSIVFCGNIISPSTSARNLGVTFDSSLSLTKHISSICKFAYYQIRQLRQIRSSLDVSSAIILANSLVISKLDYCNSLLNGLPKSSINRLQVVQNSLARAIYLSAKRSDHVSQLLHKLHWLPVSSRIEFKIATLTFKVLKFQQPAYMFDLIAPYVPPRSLRSSNKNLLIVPRGVMQKNCQGRLKLLGEMTIEVPRAPSGETPQASRGWGLGRSFTPPQSIRGPGGAS